ncbi:hypothetical protein CTAYLR_003728 [Chrysophaeum taylorii]|uniref:6-pyruvoyltetrahydropterin synthase n=1 Tax=Chrysophaeum taylorii TaxID=2483200 RepID=A0AAD7XMS4_9STRA|nr:hypothetical protein CTAYLR_003728 [Chrysophaeum taylorii]
MPWTVGVRERCMYSHSLRFGSDPPFRTGCTAVVDALFEGESLTDDGVLIDIILAQHVSTKLRQVLDTYDHKDLDELEEFKDKNTTVEVVARAIFDKYRVVTRLEITVRESDVARASYYQQVKTGLFTSRS